MKAECLPGLGSFITEWRYSAAVSRKTVETKCNVSGGLFPSGKFPAGLPCNSDLAYKEGDEEGPEETLGTFIFKSADEAEDGIDGSAVSAEEACVRSDTD